MVPEEFHEFFVAAAGVAGALIGLLFVAISVVPDSVADGARSALRVRPSAALSAFLNALLTSLLALVPGVSIGGVVTVLAAAGLLAMLTLLGVLLRDRRVLGGRDVVRAAVFVVGQGAVYVVELLRGLDLQRDPTDPAPLTAVAVLVVILFLLGIARAWEFVGAESPGLVRALVEVGRSR